MRNVRIDAPSGRILEEPGPCSCATGVGAAKGSCQRVGWRDTPNGPRAFLVPCGKTDGEKSRLDRALDKQAEEARDAAKEGPPAGALTRK